MVTKKAGLSVQDIVVLMEKCAEHGVLQFKYGDLEFSLHNKSNVASDSPISPAPPTPQELEQANSETMAIDELRSKQDRIEQLIIEDPLQAEMLLATRELEDEENGRSEED